jgi:hypothetical protein
VFPEPSPKGSASQGPPNATPNAPSVTLPLRFLITGLLALAAGICLLVLRPDVLTTYHYNQYVISITHVFVLGWIATVVMGAMYQLVPVALESRLYSERLAAIHFVLHVVGVGGMVWMFWTWNMKQVGHFGSVFGAGVLLFIYNLGRTLLRVPRFNVIAAAVASTLFWLGCTVLVGLTIAAGKCSYESVAEGRADGWFNSLLLGMAGLGTFVARFDAIAAIHAHAHLGVVGIFVILIVGVSYRLLPMFTLSELQSVRRAVVSLALLNLGLALCFPGILLRSPWKPFAAAILAAGLVVYAIEIRAILRARKRRTLDWGVSYFITAISGLAPVVLLGWVLSWPKLPLTAFTGQLETAYGLLALLGVVSFAIIGMLYKIVPFVVWYSCYSQQIGRGKVPALADLYSHGLQAHGYWTFLSGLAFTTAGTVLANAPAVRIGCVTLGASILLLLINIGLMFSHFARSRRPGLPRDKNAPILANYSPTS